MDRGALLDRKLLIRPIDGKVEALVVVVLVGVAATAVGTTFNIVNILLGSRTSCVGAYLLHSRHSLH